MPLLTCSNNLESMADFTSTLTLTATSDTGRRLDRTFTMTIEDVYGLTKTSGNVFTIADTSQPFALMIAQIRSGATNMTYGASADSAVVSLRGDQMVMVHGPVGFDEDTNASTATVTQLLSGDVTFDEHPGTKVDFLALKTPVS